MGRGGREVPCPLPGAQLASASWQAPASRSSRHCCRARAQGSRPWSTTRRCATPFASPTWRGPYWPNVKAAAIDHGHTAGERRRRLGHGDSIVPGHLRARTPQGEARGQAALREAAWPVATVARAIHVAVAVLLEASRGGRQAMPMEMGNYSLPSIAAPALLYCSRLSAAEGWPRAEVLVVGQPTRRSSTSAWTTTTPIPPIGDLAIHAKAPPAALAEATQPAIAALALAPQA